MNRVRGEDEFWDSFDALSPDDMRRPEIEEAYRALGDFGPVFPSDHPFRSRQKIARVQQGKVFSQGFTYDLEDGSGFIEYTDLEDGDDHYITMRRLVWL